MIGILTEITGNPTPSEIPLVVERQIPRNGLPYPVDPQPWSFRQSIDYSVSLNLAILDYAARNGDKLLYNFYRMGRNSIEKGDKDHWTKYPRYVQEMELAYARDRKEGEINELETG
ncbi:MAG: peptidase, partial [Sphingobacterium sp.]